MSFWDRFRRTFRIPNDRPAFVKVVENTTLEDDYICGVLKIPPDIINLYKKEDNMTNEYIEGFAQRKAELEAERFALENADIEALVNAKFEEVKQGIREEVIAKHNEEIEDKNIEIKAIERLIAREVAKIEAETVEGQEGQEGVEA